MVRCTVLARYGGATVEHATPSGRTYGLPSSALSYGTISASARRGTLRFKAKGECCNGAKDGSLILLRLGLPVSINLDVQHVEFSIAIIVLSSSSGLLS